MTTLRDALSTTGRTPSDTTAVIDSIDTAAGTVTLDVGGGILVPGVRVLVSAGTLGIGQTVAVMRYPGGQRLVLGPVASTLAAPAFRAELVIPWTVNPAASGSSLVVSAVSSGSWRSSDGWAGTYMPTTDTVAQGSYSSSSPYYRGCWFYGSGFASGRGRTCSSITIRVPRLSAGGSSAATRQVIGPHVHATKPSGEPLFPWGAVEVGSLTWGQTAELTLPTWMGDLLLSGQAAGLGHLLLAYGSGSQSYAKGVAADALSGRVTMGLA